MTAPELAAAIGRMIDTDSPGALARLARELRRQHVGDDEAETIARQAEHKRSRITREN